MKSRGSPAETEDFLAFISLVFAACRRKQLASAVGQVVERDTGHLPLSKHPLMDGLSEAVFVCWTVTSKRSPLF